VKRADDWVGWLHQGTWTLVGKRSSMLQLVWCSLGWYAGEHVKLNMGPTILEMALPRCVEAGAIPADCKAREG
jgi:hypothetical protein